MTNKEKYSLEYLFDARSSRVLWNSISTPLGLQEWFADQVVSDETGYLFTWDGTTQKAELLFMRSKSVIRFRWEDDEEEKDRYFEFKIASNELTNQLSLVISDFAEEEDMEDSKRLWDSQIETLRRNTGMR